MGLTQDRWYLLTSEGNIFTSSIRKSVLKVLKSEDPDTLEGTFNQLSTLVMLSIKKMPPREDLKNALSKVIEANGVK